MSRIFSSGTEIDWSVNCTVLKQHADKVMRLPSAHTLSVFKMAMAFRPTREVQHIISNFQLIQEMLLVDASMASVFRMAKVFQ
jgi:hypothetical protein